MSFRNRCQIAGAEGVIDLSIPLVKGRDQKSLLRDVKISDRGRWQDQHWKTILSCYSRSPWFEFYRDGLAELYGKPFAFLMDWNLACFEWSLGMLQMPVQFALTEAWQKSYDGNEWMDWRGKILPKNTGKLGGPAGKPGNNLPPGTVTVPSSGTVASPDSLKYRQVFEERTGFLPGLSILDLLFCEGKRAKSLLTGALPGADADLARSPDQM